MTGGGNALIAGIERQFARKARETFCELIGPGGEDAMSWQELERLARRYACAYADAGIGEGRLVLVFLRHSRDLYGAFFGAMLAGAVPSYMPCTSPRQVPGIYWSSHQMLLDRICPAAIVATRATFAEMEDAGLEMGNTRRILSEELGEEEGATVARAGHSIALLQHSSGTTGLKKGVALTYDAIVAQLESYGKAIQIASNDVIVSWLPLYHDMGLMACCLLPAYMGVPIVHIDPFTWLAKPELMLEALTKRQGTLVWLPNFAFEHMARTARTKAALYDLSGVRAFINCSEPCKPGTFDRFAAAFAEAGVRPDQLQCCYAMAETVFAASQTDLARPAARLRVEPRSLERGEIPRRVGEGEAGQDLVETGRPIDGIDVAIYDENRRPLPQPAVGEIGISGDFLFSGYNADPERTAERLVDGTYFSRDLGFIDGGRLYVLGRIDDLIIVNGRNLYAHEIERVASGVAGLKPGRSVAVPFFDERIASHNLVLIAERQRDATETEAEIRREIVRTLYSVFEVTPWRVHIVEEGWLIKTTSGKISRSENLARLQTNPEGPRQ